MSAALCWFAVILVIASAVLHLRRTRPLASWLLVPFPMSLGVVLWFDISHDSLHPGQAGYRSDLKTLPYLLGFLVITFVAALRPKWGWLFWIAWTFSALIAALLVFFTFLFG